MSKSSKARRDAKRKKEKKVRKIGRNRPHQKSRDESPVFFEDSNPFEKMNEEQRAEVIRNLAQNCKERLPVLLDEIEALCKEYDPIKLIAILNGYHMVTSAGDNGVEMDYGTGKINQSHIELLQAIILRLPQDHLGTLPPTSETVQTLSEKLLELTQSYSFFRLDNLLEDTPELEQGQLGVQEFVRGYTQSVRNWGFVSQMTRITKELYQPLNDKLMAEYQFDSSKIIDIITIILDEMGARLSTRMTQLSNLYQTKNKRKLLAEYYDLTGQEKDEETIVTESDHFRDMKFKQLFFIILSHFDLKMSDYFIFSPEEISAKSGLDTESVESVLKHFSFEPGDLENFNREFIFLDNPIWKKPFIKIDGIFYCFVPQIILHSAFTVMNSLCEDRKIKEVASVRSNYLEEKIKEIVITRFPEVKTISNLKWKESSIEYENDLITFIDNFALIIEAKSQKVSARALRGAPERIKRHLDDLVFSPSIQSKRLQEKLQYLCDNPDVEHELREKIPVPLSDIKNVRRVSVSLEDLGSIQSNIQLLKDTGWIPNEFSQCPTMNLADFQTVFDLLEHPVQILHYLSRREELAEKYEILGDELDLLGLYMDTLLSVDYLFEDENLKLTISGMSMPIDRYYMSKEQGIHITKPTPKITNLFSRIFQQLEERSSSGWSEIGCILNSISPKDQKQIETSIKTLKKQVQKNWKKMGHNNMLIYAPPKMNKYAFAYVMHKNENSHLRDEFIEHATFHALTAEHVQYCLVVVKNIDDDKSAYHFIGLMQNK